MASSRLQIVTLIAATFPPARGWRKLFHLASDTLGWCRSLCRRFASKTADLERADRMESNMPCGHTGQIHEYLLRAPLMGLTYSDARNLLLPGSPLSLAMCISLPTVFPRTAHSNSIITQLASKSRLLLDPMAPPVKPRLAFRPNRRVLGSLGIERCTMHSKAWMAATSWRRWPSMSHSP